MRNPKLAPELLNRYQINDEVQFKQILLLNQGKNLHFEIGSGNGHFFTDLAAGHPDDFLVGCELDKGRVAKTILKLNLKELTHAALYAGRAETILTWFEDQSITNIYINFPDPWPKKRHHRRRFFYPAENLRLAVSKLKTGGKFYFVSDHKEYFFFALEERLLKEPRLKCRFPEGYAHSLENYYPTLYEERFRAEGREIFYTVFDKIS